MSRDMTRLRGWCAVSGHRNNMPLDASFFPNGDIATVTLGDDYALYVSPLSESVLDTSRIWITSGQLGGVIDRYGVRLGLCFPP